MKHYSTSFVLVSIGTIVALCSAVWIFTWQSVDEDIPFETIESHTQIILPQVSPVGYSHTSVITTQDKWENLWKELFGEQEPPPSVDFTKLMIIAVVANPRPTIGYKVVIRKILKDYDGIEVRAVELKPSDWFSQLYMLSRPYHIVLFPKFESSIKFNISECSVWAYNLFLC